MARKNKDKSAQRKLKEKRKAKSVARKRCNSVQNPIQRINSNVQPSKGLIENRRFNRFESALENRYYNDHGIKGTGEVEYDGWIKCRLLHGIGYSLIVPDQIYIEHNGLRWIQPLAFGPNHLEKSNDTEILSDLNIDISCGHRLRVIFLNDDHISDLPDGSQLFKCRIIGVADLPDFTTGEACWSPNGGNPYLRLYHHTTDATVPLILKSGHFRTGACNIQGASKQLKNVAYAYFTPLDTIRTNGDLNMVAMSIDGTIELRRDGFNPPKILLPNYLETFKQEILQLKVYKSDPAKRDACIELWIDATVLAPQHYYCHDEGGRIYYELPHPFIQRVGTEPDVPLTFDHNREIHQQKGLKRFEYVVVGDCTTLEGLAAPYDEEDTTHLLKIERIQPGTTMLDFWFSCGNTDLYSGKKFELQEFDSPSDPNELH